MAKIKQGKDDMDISEEVFKENLKQFINSSIKSAVNVSMKEIVQGIGNNMKEVMLAQTQPAGSSRYIPSTSSSKSLDCYKVHFSVKPPKNMPKDLYTQTNMGHWTQDLN